MAFKIVAPIAAVCMLAGCTTTTTTDPWSDGARVDTWQGLDVREMIPPLELSAVANHARSQGRVIGGGRGNGGAYVLSTPSELASACANSISDDAALTGCTVRRADTGGYTYTVYVNEAYPEWYRELIGTREFGHVAQSERGMPIDRAGFTSPTVGLIDRLGG
ncbi:MAG: hypothetical protein IT534_08190 [Bauldia sp.]|nr:hypothetical protein [Bauldia sp.]